MRNGLLFILLLTALACKRYKDPAPFTDSRIKNKYCNDPAAINYNWDFPGIPDNSVCIYPAQIYQGSYFYRDSIFNAAGTLLAQDSFNISIIQIDSTHLTISGFCDTTKYTARATRYYTFTLDSLLGNGQLYCNNKDTIAGKGIKNGIGDTSFLKLIYTLQTDTGVSYHSGTATKF
ncbi:MAG: hypothetical protein JNJ58_04170 [Chitinophagaceae bacterium]|nr:hypothetical protein [Chitinophagaceae bacterium]